MDEPEQRERPYTSYNSTRGLNDFIAKNLRFCDHQTRIGQCLKIKKKKQETTTTKKSKGTNRAKSISNVYFVFHIA